MPDNKPSPIHDATPSAIAVAADRLRAGGLVALPTETVYGLAARADSDSAVAAIYRAKGRPDFNPLIVHVADMAMAGRYAVLDSRAIALIQIFWPGPLTLVLPLKPSANIAKAVTAGLPTIALRIPAHPVIRAVLTQLQLPLAAPSANHSGGVSPSCAAHVANSLGRNVDMILDGGPCVQGIESTIVALRPDHWQILRHGPISEWQIAEILGETSLNHATNLVAIEAPGQLASHYSPGKPLRLNVDQAGSDEFHIGFGAINGDVNLSERGDLAQSAAQLYAALHMAAAAAQSHIAVAPIPHHGIGIAINDRLNRAAITPPP
ncbi:MAG: Threonylcarbamoyl-AMP synthase [Pseudomonadota bacterium]|jgi:L-threonylcarbamoyladenylate synthase